MAFKATSAQSFYQERGIFVRPDITSVPSSEVYARVACQLVAIELRHRPNNTRQPEVITRHCAACLPLDGFGMVRFALHSLAVSLDQGMTGNAWLQSVCYRAAMGGTFRRHFFEGYKENRSPYPRVTNRGVQSPPTRSISPIGRVKRDDSTS